MLITALLCVKSPACREGLGGRSWGGRGVGGAVKGFRCQRGLRGDLIGDGKLREVTASVCPLSHPCHPLLLTPASSEEQEMLWGDLRSSLLCLPSLLPASQGAIHHRTAAPPLTHTTELPPLTPLPTQRAEYMTKVWPISILSWDLKI